jgi:hypothetical protein
LIASWLRRPDTPRLRDETELAKYIAGKVGGGPRVVAQGEVAGMGDKLHHYFGPFATYREADRYADLRWRQRGFRTCDVVGPVKGRYYAMFLGYSVP